MKRYFFIFTFIAFTLAPFSASAFTVVISGQNINQTDTGSGILGFLYTGTGGGAIHNYYPLGDGDDLYDTSISWGSATRFDAIEKGGLCQLSASYSVCAAAGTTIYTIYRWPDTSLHFTPYVPAVVPTFGDLITSASNGISTTTGFDVAGVVTWAGDNLIKIFIGSGLALLFELRYWITALMVIAAIVFFSYRAFRFFRH